tara:strand:+ start:601 stop:753 length:153 start_codon:yes stop_codon:yes gene_type:complete
MVEGLGVAFLMSFYNLPVRPSHRFRDVNHIGKHHEEALLAQRALPLRLCA